MLDCAYTRLLLDQDFSHSELCSLLMEWECRRRGAEISRAAPLLFVATLDGRAIPFLRSVGPGVSTPAERITRHKHATKGLLAAAGIRVPEGLHLAASQAREAEDFATAYDFNVVIKPLSQAGGAGVVTEITDRADFRKSWSWLAGTRLSNRGLIVEERITGADYRLFVVGGHVVAALQRMPAEVMGDGVSSIGSLVAQKNQRRATNPDLRARPCVIDAVVQQNLARQKLSEESVLPRGQRLRLRNSANLSKGGESVDVTDLVHRGFRELATRAVAAIPGGLLHSSVDFLAEAIDQPPGAANYAINELEGNPGMSIHHFPFEGAPRNVAASIVDAYFPVTSPTPTRADDLDSESSLAALRASIRCLNATRISDTRPAPDIAATGEGVTNEAGETVGCRALVEGRVIGVGFRQWVEQHAERRNVSGWVRNRSDRRVEIVMRGANSQVAALLALCREGPPAASVTKVRVTPVAGAAQSGFRCRATARVSRLWGLPGVVAAEAWLRRRRAGRRRQG